MDHAIKDWTNACVFSGPVSVSVRTYVLACDLVLALAFMIAHMTSG
jgi:hypothetical protein